ncbi:MAG: HAMP domain-containing sensor histidine kinase [Bacteroidales bacterium]|nr:HAMP domain-containing sensor histidine kinase [Bacteroidales bacterium]
MYPWAIILITIVAVMTIIVVTVIYVREQDRKKLEYMLDAFEDNELNFRFQDNSRFNRTLNRIKWILERKRQQDEQESWTKLIRVLTHEIMNTVSPIASLSEALSHWANVPEKEREMDLKAGLETIASSSNDLIGFVQSYRELAGVARPIMKALMLDHLVNKVIGLTLEQCNEAGAVCTYCPKTDDILIYADESQIFRILINLIKNAVQAGAKHILITAEINQYDQTLVHVWNDGVPISPESQEQIFIPFFTTKQEGTGIGLSLSRQIMRAHNGMLDLTRSDEQGTEFTLTFR